MAVLLAENGSLTPAEITVAARGTVELLYLVDTGTESDRVSAIASALAPARRVPFTDFDSCAEALRAADIEAVTTFVDSLCPLAGRLGRILRGLDDLDSVLWGRKDLQRRALVDSGLSAVASARLRDASSLLAFAADHGFPFVVKPVAGVSSRDTWLIDSEGAISEFLAARQYPKSLALSAMFAEEYIRGEQPPAPNLADYVSVDVFLSVGRCAATIVTDRLVPARPFRETGAVFPTSLPADREKAVTDYALSALAALNVPDGVYHVELKPTTRPEVIEVNGRMGGFIARLARYGAQADLGRAALLAPAGRLSPLNLDWHRAVLVMTYQAPAAARTVVASPARREIASMPGVLAVDAVSAPGQPVDWRDGTGSAVATVWLGADNHGDLRARMADVSGLLAAKFAFDCNVCESSLQ